MKVFKTANNPTKKSFMADCNNYKTFYQARQRGENQSPFAFDSQIIAFVSQQLLDQRQGREPPELEFINLTESEWRKKEEAQKRREASQECQTDDQQKEQESRQSALTLAASDVKHKKAFMRAEMNKAGFTVEELVINMVEERHDGKRDQGFWKKRRQVQEALEKEIKEVKV